MTQVWWPLTKAIRDKLVALIQDRAMADGVHVGEVVHATSPRGESYHSTSIRVLAAGDRPLGGNENTPTSANERELRFQALCRAQAFSDQDFAEQLGDLVGVVVDAVDASPFFGVTTETGAAGTVEQAYILEVSDPDVGEEGDNAEAFQIVTIACKIARGA